MNGLQNILDTMVSQPAFAAALAGLLSTLITSMATQRGWTASTKRWFALGVALVLTAIGMLVTFRPVDWSQVAAMYAVAVGVCQSVYTVLKSLGIADWLDLHTRPVEDKTDATQETTPT